MSEMNKQLEPKLRFEGFTKVWAESKLFKFYEIIDGDRGKNYPSEKDFTNNGYCLFLNAKNVTKTGFVFNETAYISKEKDHSMGKGKLEMNDLVLTSRGTIGNIANYDRSIPYKNIRINSGMLIIRNKNNSSPSNFLYQYFYTQIFYKCLFKIAFGSAQPQLTVKDIKSLKITFPNVEEQTAIGNFFQQLDKLIELQTRAVESAETYKKAMLQKMFPQKGEKVPRVRFEGFSGDWKLSVLNKLADRFDNLRIPVTASDRIEGETPYYGANGIQGYVEGFTHEGEFVLLAEDGANDLTNYPVQHVFGRIWVNNHAHVLGAKKNIMSNSYLANVLKTTNMIPYLVGSGRAKLNSSAMMEIKIKYPALKEQTLIGSFFQKLDQNIESEKKKLEQYKTMKRALLQRMFV